MLFNFFVILTSFLVGFAMKRGGLCTYTAVLQIVHENRLERMMVFLGASAWATLVILPLSWLLPNYFELSLTHHQLSIAILGGMILGIGSFINKGCFFGTFVQLVSGNLNYIVTLLGLSAEIIIIQRYFDHLIPTNLTMTEVNSPTPNAYIWLIGMSIFALFMVFSIKMRGDGIIKKLTGLCTMSWQSSFAMIVIGIGGGLLYVTVNGWNYADVLANITKKLSGTQTDGPSNTALISTLSMVLGGIIAAVTAKEFAIKPARLIMIVSCFLGGLLMGSAALLTPGGNDGLLLKDIPSFAPHALIGYSAMVIMMWVLVALFRNKALSKEKYKYSDQ